MAVEAANRAYQTHGEIDGVKTGFFDLDAKLGGLSNGNLIILAGRPSMGKTALATNIAANVAKTGDHVHFFSQEMTALELGQRQLSEYSEVASDRIRTGNITESDFRKISEAARRLSGLSMTIDETGANTISAIATKARRIKRTKKTKLLIVDYLQIMGTAGKGGNRVNDITEITVGLKALAKDLDLPIIALSQLSREVEKRENKRPLLSDLRESGSIEQDADVVMFVFREEYYVERMKPDARDMGAIADWSQKMTDIAGKAEVIIGKQRHGSVGTVEMAFDGARTRFSDLARVPLVGGYEP
jgi:replicative DNA helicase